MNPQPGRDENTLAGWAKIILGDDELKRQAETDEEFLKRREKIGHLQIERNLFLVPLDIACTEGRSLSPDDKPANFEIQMGTVRIGEVRFNRHLGTSIRASNHYSLHFLATGGSYCGDGEVDLEKTSGRCKLAAHILERLARDCRDHASEFEADGD